MINLFLPHDLMCYEPKPLQRMISGIYRSLTTEEGSWEAHKISQAMAVFCVPLMGRHYDSIASWGVLKSLLRESTVSNCWQRLSCCMATSTIRWYPVVIVRQARTASALTSSTSSSSSSSDQGRGHPPGAVNRRRRHGNYRSLHSSRWLTVLHGVPFLVF